MARPKKENSITSEDISYLTTRARKTLEETKIKHAIKNKGKVAKLVKISDRPLTHKEVWV